MKALYMRFEERPFRQMRRVKRLYEKENGCKVSWERFVYIMIMRWIE